tara:strand:+ start:4704 stop:5243 length:540 start_codon:yes stop_codon:yes gene_type:complete
VSVWIALLRGVNVGGANKLPMADFRALLSAQGFGDVATYIQSGNAVFLAEGTPDALSGIIRDGIAARFGFRPDVIVLPLDALDGALAANPFPEADDAPNQLHLFFLGRPDTLDTAPLQGAATAGERLAQRGAVLYLHTPNGFGRSKLAEKLARHFSGVPMTGRNLRSCRKIAELARGIG